MKILTDYPLSSISYYQIGGKAKVVLQVQNRKDVEEAFRYIQDNSVSRVLPMGIGSNTLIDDKPFNGAVIWFSKGTQDTIQLMGEDTVYAFSQALLDEVIQFGFNNNLIGLEWAGGLPSSIGGAIRGNVGAFGGEIKRSIISADVVDLNKETFEIKTMSNEDLQFAYRDSLVKQNKNLLIVGGLFQLKKVTSEELESAKKEYSDHIEYRKKNHAVEYPSCGSTFKNIVEKEKVSLIVQKWPDVQEQVTTKWHGKVAMGYVIKRLGFSGLTVGGAQVSEKHANYIINKNNATFEDVLTIITTIQHRVQSEFGFVPETEVEIVK